MRRNRSRFWRQQKGLPVPRRLGFARYSGATTPKMKPLGSVRMTSERTTHTYLLAAPNLEDEIHLKGVSLVTSQILDLVLHIIHIIASYFSMQNRRLERFGETLSSKPYFRFATSFLREALVGLAWTTPVGSSFHANLD